MDGNSGVDLLHAGARTAPAKRQGRAAGGGTVIWKGGICSATQSGTRAPRALRRRPFRYSAMTPTTTITATKTALLALHILPSAAGRSAAVGGLGCARRPSRRRPCMERPSERFDRPSKCARLDDGVMSSSAIPSLLRKRGKQSLGASVEQSARTRPHRLPVILGYGHETIAVLRACVEQQLMRSPGLEIDSIVCGHL